MIGKINTKVFNINGIIEQYTAGSSNVNAGDFVSFINGLAERTAAQIYSGSDDSYLSAVALGKNKVFIAYQYNSYLRGIVCTIKRTTITVGTATTIAPYSYNLYISATALSDSKVFISYGQYQSYSDLYGIVCTVNGSNITVGNAIILDAAAGASGTYLYYSTIAVALGSDKVLIIWGYNSSYHYLRGVVCTISGTTITKGTITSLSTVANSGYGFMSAVALNDNDVFIAHDYNGSNYYLYGLVCRINGTTISVGTDTYLSTKGYIASATLLSPNKVFVAHRGDNNYLYGLVCLVNNMTISPGTDTLLRNVSSFRVSPVTLNNNYVFIAHCPSDIGNLYYTTCAIDNTTITTTTIAKQSDYSYFYGLSVVRYTDHNMIVIYANSKLYGRLVGGYTITSTTSVDQNILGVAKTNAVAGATVDVYVPNI